MKEGCRIADAESVDLSQDDTHTSPIWQECPWAQLELAFHITLKFLDFREQPYKGGTDSTDRRRRTEREKIGGGRGRKRRFLYSRTQRTRCFNQSYHFEKILTRDYLPKLEAPFLFPSISMWGGFGVCFFLFFFFLLICFYFQILFLFALFSFVLS